MFTMQAFHNRLFSAEALGEGYFASLARLTRASLEQLAALKSDLAWADWA